MKKLFQKIVSKLVKRAVSKSVSDVVNNPEVQSAIVPMDEAKKKIWRFVIQTLISILTAILTALGATSCISHL